MRGGGATAGTSSPGGQEGPAGGPAYLRRPGGPGLDGAGRQGTCRLRVPEAPTGPGRIRGPRPADSPGTADRARGVGREEQRRGFGGPVRVPQDGRGPPDQDLP